MQTDGLLANLFERRGSGRRQRHTGSLTKRIGKQAAVRLGESSQARGISPCAGGQDLARLQGGGWRVEVVDGLLQGNRLVIFIVAASGIDQLFVQAHVLDWVLFDDLEV